MKKIYEALVLFIVEFLNYCVICINMRGIAEGNYGLTIITDFTIASLNFFVIKRIADGTDTIHQWLGFSIGAATGSVAGIYISKLILGH